jgi:hypothetical protein
VRIDFLFFFSSLCMLEMFGECRGEERGKREEGRGRGKRLRRGMYWG